MTLSDLERQDASRERPTLWRISVPMHIWWTATTFGRWWGSFLWCQSCPHPKWAGPSTPEFWGPIWTIIPFDL